MSLRTVLCPTRGTADAAGVDPAHAEHERQVRQARLEVARRESSWTEIAPAELLVRRGPFLVGSETDALYVHRRGVVFGPGKATVGYVTPNTELTFYVDQHDNVVFIDQRRRTNLERDRRPPGETGDMSQRSSAIEPIRVKPGRKRRGGSLGLRPDHLACRFLRMLVCQGGAMLGTR